MWFSSVATKAAAISINKTTDDANPNRFCHTTMGRTMTANVSIIAINAPMADMNELNQAPMLLST